MNRLKAALAALALVLVLTPSLSAQTVRVRDLTVTGADIPVRLQGFGLVVGL